MTAPAPLLTRGEELVCCPLCLGDGELLLFWKAIQAKECVYGVCPLCGGEKEVTNDMAGRWSVERLKFWVRNHGQYGGLER